MFVIWGSRTFKMKKETSQNIVLCEECGYPTRWERFNMWHWFTFFFIPLFPFWMKKVWVCPSCECGVKITGKNKEELFFIFHEPTDDAMEDNGGEGNVVMERAATGEMENTETKKATETSKAMVADSQVAVAGIEMAASATEKQIPLSEVRLLNDEKEFIFPEMMREAEKRKMLKSCVIQIVLGLVLLYLGVWGGTGELFRIFALLLIVFLVVAIPVQLISYKRNGTRVLKSIRMRGNEIWLDDNRIDLRNIIKAQITSLDVRSSSPLAPAQRFLDIQTDTGKWKYWVGSQVSISDDDYLRLCDILEYGFRNKGVDFSYSLKVKAAVR